MHLSAMATDRIDTLFAQFRVTGPGCALGITRNLRPVYEKSYGLADLDFGVAIASDTSFDLASVSKQFTAMAVFMLAHEGKIGLDDDIRRYIPELPIYGAPITIRELIHHTSGLRDIYHLRSLMGLTEKDYFSEEDFLADLARQKHLAFPTGEQWRYSNTGYLLLGMMVKRVTHKTLAQFAQERIFGPLQMTHTFFADDAMRVVKNRATGYYRQKDGSFKRGVTLFEMVGDGGLISTIHDLMLWDRDFYEGKVWSPAIKADMLAPGRLKDGTVTAVGDGAVYAGGLFVGTRRGLGYIRHSGSFVGFRTDQLRFPERKLGITVLCNLNEIDAGSLSDRIADILLEHDYRAPMPKSPEAKSAPHNATPIPQEILDAFAGVYHSDELAADYRILRENGSIRILMGKREVPLDVGDYASSPLSLIGPDTVGDEVFAFKLRRSGRDVSGFEMSVVGGPPMVFARVVVRKPPAQ